jgi:hypothetical protein
MRSPHADPQIGRFSVQHQEHFVTAEWQSLQ